MAPRWRASYGTDLPSITRPNTAVGSTRRKSNWRCSHGSAWAPAGFRILKHFAERAAPGFDARTVLARESTGRSTAKQPAASSVTKGTILSGQRPSGTSRNVAEHAHRASCAAYSAELKVYPIRTHCKAARIPEQAYSLGAGRRPCDRAARVRASARVRISSNCSSSSGDSRRRS